MSRGVLWVAAACFGLGSSAASTLGAYTVSTAVSVGVDEAAAGVLVAGGSIAGLVSRLGVGHWSDRRSGDQLDLISAMMALGGVCFCLLALPNPIAVCIAAPLAFATGWSWLGSYNLAMVRLNPVSPSAAVGVTQTGAFAGAIVGPTMLGLIAERSSFSAAWVAAAVASFVAAATIALLRRWV
jgi:cyanate permease